MNEKEAADAHKAAEALYHRILKGWNDHDGDAFSAPFAEEGLVIGFDGSENVGRAGIAEQMNKIFADHETGRYVGKIKSIKVPLPDLAVVHAVAGVLPAGSDDINPKLNAVQTMVAVRRS
ncbi:SgcJ/EcaC family oxidoreductase, partial [Nocardia sp. NPDC004260]